MLSLFGFSAFAKADDPIVTLLKKLEEFTKNYPTERVYLHLDKPYYAVGDDIWFKAYVKDSRSSEPTSISNILYVDLIDEGNQLKRQIRLEMKSGIAWGDFKLADSLREGNYRVRAYTQWMRNAGPQFFFDKTIKVGSIWANKLLASANHQIGNKGHIRQLNSTLNFSGGKDAPMANVSVAYEIEIDQKKVATGTAITDANGVLNLSTPLNGAADLKTGNVRAKVKLPGGLEITKNFPISGTGTNLNIQFLPESGTLIEGLPAKVAVKAINVAGKGENIKGKIVDNEGTEVLDFETTYLGMGSFPLTPMPGKTYTAKITEPAGIAQSYPLPKSEKSGYGMMLNAADSLKIPVRIMVSEDVLNTGDLYLVIHQNGRVLANTNIPTAKQLNVFSIPKAGLPSGIITFTLFNKQLSPVAERIVFVSNPADFIQLQANGLKSNSTKSGKVEVDLLATNVSKPLIGSFSVAVTNATTVEPDLDNESHILSALLLTPDLKGNVEKPNAYFNATGLQRPADLDHLMLTQGWRKIDWKALEENKLTPQYFTAEKGLHISGLVTNNGKPVPNTKVALLSTAGGLMAIDTLTDTHGRFKFDQLKFGESNAFIVQAKTADGKKGYDVAIDKSAIAAVDPLSAGSALENTIEKSLETYINSNKAYFEALGREGRLSDIQTLKTVEIKGEKPNKAPNSMNLNGPGNASAVLDAEDLRKAGTVLNALNRVIVRGGQPAGVPVIMDGLPGPAITEIPIDDIESIEVLNGIGFTFLYGGHPSVFIVTTKTGNNDAVKQLKQVEIVGEKPSKAPNSTNLNGPGQADAIFNEKDLRYAGSLLQYLKGRVAGIVFHGDLVFLSRNDPTISIPGQENQPQPMIIFLNGSRLGEETTLDDFPINDIESVEILRSPAYTAVYGVKEGIILITTKTGVNTTIKQVNSPGVVNIMPKGYYAIRQFYTPQYTAATNQQPDRRTTVYWNPHLVTDANGKASFNFFNTDQTGKYRIVIEGIDEFGHLARKVLDYEVK